MIEERATRRELISGGLATTVGALAAATGASELTSAATAQAAAATTGDAGIFTRALEIEQLIVYCYQRVLSNGSLNSWVAGVIRGMLSQELEHVAVLQSELRTMGASLPVPPQDVTSAQRELTIHHVPRRLTNLHTQRDCLKLLIDAESVAEGEYFAAIANLVGPDRVHTAAAIMGCEAQHWTMLSGMLNRFNVQRSVPYPFVAGST